MATPAETDPSTAASPVRRRYIPVGAQDLDPGTIGPKDTIQLAEELTTNTTLKHLDLKLSKIGNDGAVALADALVTNKTLKKLDLRSNGIDDLGMEALGRALAWNHSLEKLDVSWNKFGVDGLAAFAAGLKVNKWLKELSLSGNSIDDAIMADALKVNTTLARLDLSGNGIGNEGAAALGEAIKVNALKARERYNLIDGEGVPALVYDLNPSLTVLNLGRNSIGDDGAVAMGEALKVDMLLTKLDLNGNRIGNFGAVALGEALTVNSSLTELGLWQNSIGDEGAAVLLKALTECNTTLAELYLHENDNISVNIWSAIYAFVAANKAGTRLLCARADLDLSSKEIDDVQAKRVAAELADNTTVTTLVMNKNAIGRQGCIDIVDALITNRVLMSIELDDNSIGDDGCLAMAAALRENTVLTKASLDGNNIGLPGAMALADTLRVNGSLRDLGLGRNNVGTDGAAAIAEALKCNETLERLDLHANSICDEGAMVILKALKESNCSLMWLNLEENSEISLGLQNDIVFVLGSRRVLNSFCYCLCKPLDKKLLPLVVQGIENQELARSQETAVGPIFLLVRGAALQDSKVIAE
jgi:Ran GTPase-activating protein (RanGAP) involved in mRNA processing and transport